MSSPLVSVIITTFNRFHLLQEAIQSVRDQTYPNIEIIVVNDCSTESGYELLKDYENVRFLHLQKNMREVYNVKAAQGATRNAGLQVARGDFICFLDDDDLFLPQKIEIQVSEMFKNPDILVCATNMYVFTRDENRQRQVRGLYLSNLPLPSSTPISRRVDHAAITQNNWLSLSSSMIRREMLKKVPQFRVCDYEDWLFWKDCLVFTDALLVNSPLVMYDVSTRKSYVYQS